MMVGIQTWHGWVPHLQEREVTEDELEGKDDDDDYIILILQGLSEKMSSLKLVVLGTESTIGAKSG